MMEMLSRAFGELAFIVMLAVGSFGVVFTLALIGCVIWDFIEKHVL